MNLYLYCRRRSVSAGTMFQIRPQFSFPHHFLFNLKFTLTCYFLPGSRETCSKLFSWLSSDSIQKLLLYCHQVNHGHLFTYQIIPRFLYPANEFKSTSTKEQKESLELKLTWPRTWLMKQGGNLQRKCFYNKPHVFWACLIHV